MENDNGAPAASHSTYRRSCRAILPLSVAGGLAFVADFCIPVFLAEAMNLHYLPAATVALCAGLIVNCFLSIFARRQCIFSGAERS
jgi:hypothetical protein